MLDQLLNIVKQFGKKTVVDNPDVPNEYNQDVMADATKTIASGFQNVLAGGGFRNILDLFKNRGTNQASAGGGLGGLVKNPIVSMMIGYFISKLVSKYNMKPAAASNVANQLIPNSINGLIQETNDPNNDKATLDNLVGDLVGKDRIQQGNQGGNGFLQDLLEKFTGGGNGDANGNGTDLDESLSRKAQERFSEQKEGGGLMDLIKGFMSR